LLSIATISLLSALAVTSPPVENKIEVSQPSPQAITEILPADTPLVMTVNTKGEAWSQLKQYHLFQVAVNAVSQFLPPTVNFDYAKDVESWLDSKVAFAFLPKKGSTPATLQSNFLLFAPIKDISRAQPFLNLITSDKQNTKKREYQGVTIWEIKSSDQKKSLASNTKQLTPAPGIGLPNAPGLNIPVPKLPNPSKVTKNRVLAFAVIPGYIVAGNSTQPIEQLIDSSLAKVPTLAQNPNYQKSREHPQANQALLSMYQNPEKFFTLFKDLAKDISNDPEIPIPNIDVSTFDVEPFKQITSIHSYLTLQPEGLRFQINSYSQKPVSQEIQSLTSNQETILSKMPGVTYSAFTGRNLNQQWQMLANAFSTKKELKDGLETVRNTVRTTTGLDLDKDIISWMDGEYALFLYPTKSGFLKTVSPNHNMGLALAIQTSNRSAADNALQKLEKLLTDFGAGAVKVNTRNINGKPVTSLDVTGSPSLLAYSWVDEKTLILTSGYGTMNDPVPEPRTKLAANYNFMKATGSLPRPNQGYFYMNTGSTLSWIYGLLPSVFNTKEFRPFKEVLGSVHSLSASSFTRGDQAQTDILFVMAPNRTPLKK
jgi:Protein of unknown function (DUF3352)